MMVQIAKKSLVVNVVVASNGLPPSRSRIKKCTFVNVNNEKLNKYLFKRICAVYNYLQQLNKIKNKIIIIGVREELKVKLGSTLFKYFLTINDLYNNAKIVNLPLLDDFFLILNFDFRCGQEVKVKLGVTVL